jgi:hypothetical protein
MPSTYTLNNGIELIGTGEQSGTWGDTTNTNLGLLDAALDGQVTITLAAAGSSGSPNALPITDGTASNGRNRMVVFADGADLGATAYVQLTPNDAEKIIYIRNSLSGSRSVILFQGTYNASNDYEVPAGTTAVVYFDGAGAGAVAANVFNNAYFDGLRLGSVSVTAILDEDNMASDSATALATQQSIKAYVDSQVGTVDTLAEILAIGNTTGATDIAVDSAQKVQFRDAAIYINSSVDGQLDIVADTEIQIAATTVDLNGNLDVSGTLGVTGVLTATSLDISGDIDVDGTTNLDVVDIDGATQIDATVTVGVDDTGYDVKFFGATAGAYMLWDESADDLILGGAAGLSVNSTALVTGVLTTTAATVSNGGGQFNGTVTVGVDDTGYDVKFFGATTGKSLLWDESADSLIVTGTTTLVGTTNLDAVDIDGATQIDATVTVGVDDTGYDVKFFGATAGAYMLWDESADDLILGGAAGLSVNSAATVGGTLGVTGVVTANAGVVVDNFTLDGTTLALSSGDMTLDVAGDIILDADGGDVRFKDGGTEFGTIYNTSSNLGIASIVQNKDIIFQGFDDSSLITALTLDMSDAGTAIFNHDITLAANGIFTATSTSSGDYVRLYGSGGTGKWDIYGSGANLRFGDNDNAGYVQIDTRVGIGIASPSAGLQIQGADGSVEATLVLTADSVASAGMACDAGGLVFGAESGDGFQFRTGATAADPTDSGSTIMEITSAGVLQVGEIMEQTAGADINLTMVSEDAGLAIMCRSATDGHSPYITMMKTPATSGNYTATASGDFLGLIEFRGVNTDAVSDVGAMIRVKQTGAESGTVPAEIQFHTKEVSRFVIEDGGEKVMNGATTFAAISAGTASGCSFGDAGDIYSSRATGSTSLHARFFNSTGGATYVGSISTSGSSTAYNTSSDYRLKENVNYDWDATTRLKQLKPARFNFIANPNKTVDGFLAHEAATVVPEAVCGEKDATEMQGIDQSKLVPLLVKTIQELEARITALEA